MTRRPTQPDLFGCAAPSATKTEKRAVLSTEGFDFPDSDAYRPRGIENVPRHLRMWIDDAD